VSSETVQWIALDRLLPHSANPRLIVREEVIAQIASGLGGRDFDPAHALLVRPLGENFQIISGHHRKLAAERCGIPGVPCWVREMDDDAAYVALVTSNAQAELSALERGLHALRSVEKPGDLDVRAYAARVGREKQWRNVYNEVYAAKVASAVADVCNDLSGCFSQLVEIHAARTYLWPPLVKAMLAADPKWTVEQTRKAVERVKGAPEKLARWLPDDTPQRLATGNLRLSDIGAMIQLIDQTRAKITDAEFETEKFLAEFDAVVNALRPSAMSALAELSNSLTYQQAQAKAAAMRKQEEAEERARRLYEYVSLDEWRELDDATKAVLLPPDPAHVTAGQFNKQDNAAIEWAQWSWNPITGCEHNCPYCYARDIALSGGKMAKSYPNGFAPTLRPRALLTPRNMEVPPSAADDTRYRNVFTGSMGDIFGRWVPDEWINAVLAEIRDAEQWNFLCLTKFPKRMAEFDIPPNAWMGTTVDLQARVNAAEAGFANVGAKVKWLSCEPLLEPLRFKHLDRFHWIVIGGASKSSKTPIWRPPFEWVMDLVLQARAAGLKVYMKTNLFGEDVKGNYVGNARILELPFDAPLAHDPYKAADVFHYLKQAA